MTTRMGLTALAGIGLVLAPVAAAGQQVFAYPARGQSQAQQDKDRRACHKWAVSQTGFDPGATQAPPPRQGGAVRGAAGGAAIGAVGGAIGGDAGRGAAIGAATGGIVGRVRQNRQNRSAGEQQQARVDSFNKALGTCLRGRGYTVN